MGGNSTSPLHSRGSPNAWGTKSELVGPTSGPKCYITPAFSEIPKDMGNKIRIGGAHKWAEMLLLPCFLGAPQRHGEQNQNWWGPQVGRNAKSPLHSRGSAKTWGTKSELVGPRSGRKRYITPAFSGIPKDMGGKIRIGGAHKWVKRDITPAFSGIPKDMGYRIRIGRAHKRAEMLHHPRILRDPQRHGEQNQNWWGPQVGRNAKSPLHSRGSAKTWGTKSELVGPRSGRKRYITPAFSGIPKDMGGKIRIGGAHKWAKRDITPAFSGIPKDMGYRIRIGRAHKRAEMLHHPRILRDPQRHGGQTQNSLGPQVGGNATSPVENKNRLGCFHPRLLKSKIHGVNFELFNDGAKAYKTKVQHFSKVLMYAFRLQKRPPQPVYNMKHGCTWDTK